MGSCLEIRHRPMRVCPTTITRLSFTATLRDFRPVQLKRSARGVNAKTGLIAQIAPKSFHLLRMFVLSHAFNFT